MYMDTYYQPKVNNKPTYYMGTYSIYKFFLTLSLSAHYGQISVFFWKELQAKLPLELSEGESNES